jgi:hypothetical protein
MRTLVMFILALLMSGGVANAQSYIGSCGVAPNFAPPFGIIFDFDSNLRMVQRNNPMNQGYAARDASGMTYLMLPSTNPNRAYFVRWDGGLVEVVAGRGWQIVGSCSIAPPPPPPVFFPVASPDFGVPVPGGLAALPAPIVNPSQPFGLPLVASEAEAIACGNDHPDPGAADFGRCVVRSMLGSRERAVYDCSREEAEDSALMSACVVGALGGSNERRIAANFADCYKQAGGNYQSFGLCMAGQQFDGDMGTLVQCLSHQPPGDASVMGTAVCYGASKLNLNAEAQIVVQCAVATDGEPEAFAGCAGGELTAREIDKCRTKGIGGDGCFGPNNDLVKYMRAGGLHLAEIYGPLNPLVKSWNQGVDAIIAGSRDEGLRLLKSAADAAVSAGGDAAERAGRAVHSVMPRITVGTPRGKIFGKRFSL